MKSGRDKSAGMAVCTLRRLFWTSSEHALTGYVVREVVTVGVTTQAAGTTQRSCVTRADMTAQPGVTVFDCTSLASVSANTRANRASLLVPA